jgi:hypothetical protein
MFTLDDKTVDVMHALLAECHVEAITKKGTSMYVIPPAMKNLGSKLDEMMKVVTPEGELFADNQGVVDLEQVDRSHSVAIPRDQSNFTDAAERVGERIREMQTDVLTVYTTTVKEMQEHIGLSPMVYTLGGANNSIFDPSEAGEMLTTKMQQMMGSDGTWDTLDVIGRPLSEVQISPLNGDDYYDPDDIITETKAQNPLALLGTLQDAHPDISGPDLQSLQWLISLTDIPSLTTIARLPAIEIFAAFAANMGVSIKLPTLGAFGKIRAYSDFTTWKRFLPNGVDWGADGHDLSKGFVKSQNSNEVTPNGYDPYSIIPYFWSPNARLLVDTTVQYYAHHIVTIIRRNYTAILGTSEVKLTCLFNQANGPLAIPFKLVFNPGDALKQVQFTAEVTNVKWSDDYRKANKLPILDGTYASGDYYNFDGNPYIHYFYVECEQTDDWCVHISEGDPQGRVTSDISLMSIYMPDGSVMDRTWTLVDLMEYFANAEETLPLTDFQAVALLKVQPYPYVNDLFNFLSWIDSRQARNYVNYTGILRNLTIRGKGSFTSLLEVMLQVYCGLSPLPPGVVDEAYTEGCSLIDCLSYTPEAKSTFGKLTIRSKVGVMLMLSFKSQPYSYGGLHRDEYIRYMKTQIGDLSHCDQQLSQYWNDIVSSFYKTPDVPLPKPKALQTNVISFNAISFGDVPPVNPDNPNIPITGIDKVASHVLARMKFNRRNNKSVFSKSHDALPLKTII